jgi:hypothetical protein
MMEKDPGLIELDDRGRVLVTMAVTVAVARLIAIASVQERGKGAYVHPFR